MRRTIGVLIVALTFAVPDLLACGDKFLLTGRFTQYQRPKNLRAASVLIYAEPGSALAATMRQADTEKLLRSQGHGVNQVHTPQALSNSVSSGHYDMILTAKSDSTEVDKLVRTSPDAPTVVPVDDLLKNRSLLQKIDKVVEQRDKDLKKKSTKR